MAILAANGQDPNNQAGQPNAGGSGTIMNSGPTPVGGGSAPGASASPSGSNTPAQQQTNRGNPSGTPNVNDYLNANQNAGQNLANGITNNVQNQANQVNNQVNTSNNSLNAQYNPLNTTLQGGQAAANTAFQDPQALLSAYQNAQAQSAQGTAYTGAAPNNTDLANYNAFQGDVAGTAQYQQNQQGIQNYNTAGQQAYNQNQTALGNLNQVTSSGANEMGRNQLLQNTVGNPNYNQGQQTLDSLFLQGQGNQLQQNLSGIQNQTAQNVSGANTDYQSKLSALQNLAGQNTSYASNLFLNGPGTGANAPQGTGLNQIGNNVNSEYTAQQAALPAEQQAYANAIQDNTYTPAQLAALGMTQGEQTWGLTPAQIEAAGGFANNTLQAQNAGGNAQVATPEEFARYNALNALAGGPSGALQNSIFGSATTAGGFTPVSFNNAGLLAAAGQQQQAVMGTDYNNALQATETALRNLSGGGYTNGMANNFAGQLSQLGSSGTPQQAEADIQKYIQQMQTVNGAGRYGLNNATGDYSALNAFQNYYNSQFLPGATGVVNENFQTTPTVTNGANYTLGPNGQIMQTPAASGPAHFGTPINMQNLNDENQLIANASI